MSKKGVPLTIAAANPYVDDFGNTQEGLNFTFYPPSDYSDDNIDSIRGAIGAADRVNSENICAESSDFSPRKLKFTRSNGNSFSVPVYNRAEFVSIANAVLAITQALTPKVKCVELIGESWIDVRDDLRTTASGANQLPPIEPDPTASKNRFFYSGAMSEYKRDSGSTFGENDVLPFKMQTDVDDTPYSGLTAQINGCLGTIETNGLSCGRKGRIITPRRFIPSILTRPYIEDPENEGSQIPDPTESDNLQTLTIPSHDSVSTEIIACGRAIANVAAVICLAYRGESNNRFHKQLNLSP